MKIVRQSRLTKVLIGVCLVGLALSLVQCKSQPAPPEVTATMSEFSGTGDGTTAPGVTVVPTPTRTQGEQAADALGRDITLKYFPTFEECHDALLNQRVDVCSATKSATQVTHSVWEQLLPNVRFYETVFFSQDQKDGHLGPPTYGYRLVAWQDNQYYQAEDFDRLLVANGITAVTDENRELVAKAFALMTLPTFYIKYEVTFELEEFIPPQPHQDCNYRLRGWTELKGFELFWYFVFDNERLEYVVGPGIADSRVGDYANYPPEVPTDLYRNPESRDFDFGP